MHPDFEPPSAGPTTHPRDPGTRARAADPRERPTWPAIVLRTPKGWTGPREVDGVPVEGTFRAHQVPARRRAREPRAPGLARALAAQLRPDELLRRGRAAPHRAGRPRACRRQAHGREPARQRRPSAGRSALPRRSTTTRSRSSPGSRSPREHAAARRDGARPDDRQRGPLPPLLPRRDQLEPARRRLRGRGPLPAGRRGPRTRTSRRTGA